EVTDATKRVLEATGVTFEWETVIIGTEAQEKTGTPLPAEALESIRRNGTAIKGPVTTPIASGFRSVNVALRKELDLYACLRPCKSFPGVQAPYKEVDIVVVRENTEGLYAGIEFDRGGDDTARLRVLVDETLNRKIPADAAVSLRVISDSASERIVRFAFEYARANGRKKVTAVHKSNILKFSDGTFLKAARHVAVDYPDIEFTDVLLDACCMHLAKRPHQFDVLVTPNFYGDLVSDLCAGLVGGLGVAPGANIGEHIAVFEPTHGSAPKYAGMNKVNPIATMLSGVLMLRHLGETDAADRMEKAIAAVIAEGTSVTYDMKADRDDLSAVTTSEVADAIIEKLRQ
ncbi:isocitrate/isopropylmalate dehydrogenase family protein, partial [Candidatus Bipolaricaulota bacterium]|nr:isocitrate/isopropylmalate dehydrogenase family protein [Candidatus Bipolaricaulota bacterium]